MCVCVCVCVCVCSLLTAVCVHLDGSNAVHKFRVWVTILGHMSLHFTCKFQINKVSVINIKHILNGPPSLVNTELVLLPIVCHPQPFLNNHVMCEVVDVHHRASARRDFNSGVS